MRISDWSSDVCSSDLLELCDLPARLAHADDVLEWFEAAWNRRHAIELHAEQIAIERDEAVHVGRRQRDVVHAANHGLSFMRRCVSACARVSSSQIGRAHV